MEKAFNQFIAEAEVPVLVDFWAEWCAPCKVMAPVLSEFAIKYKNRVKVIKVNVDKKPHLSAQFQVQGIPTLILFKKNEIVWRESGARSLADLEYQLSSHL